MACSQNKIQMHNKLDESTALELGDGWSGRAVLSNTQGRSFSKADWLKCLSKPHLMFENVEKTLKSHGQNCVVVKNLKVGDSIIKVVVKRHYPSPGLKQFFRSFMQGRALRSFNTTLELLRRGIPTAFPLAALQKKRNSLTEQSIYITEYSEDSVNLHAFLSEQLSAEQKEQCIIKKQLSRQLADILAKLHKNGFWYRDSKANNFIVCKNSSGDYEVLLTDVDGIKPYLLCHRTCRYRCLWQLAASTLSIPAVNRTDYFRAFTAYSDLTGIEHSQRHNIFRELLHKAEAKRRRSAIKNILIIKPSSLGDVVLALPALSALRRSFPKAKISWLIRPEFAPLLKNHPDLDEVIFFDRKFLGKAWFHPGALSALLLLIQQLRYGKFDVVFDLQGLFRTASLSWLSRCRKRFGMAGAGEFGYIFYTYKVTQDRDCIHLVDYYLNIVRAAGASKTDVQFVLPIAPDAEDAVKKLLKANGINGPYACFVPTSARQDKCWPIENFAVLADKVSRESGLSIIATGAASEKSIVEELKNEASVPVANFAGATSISELVALLKGAKLVVSNDTGPGHIAAALGVPIVLIFGPTNPARVHPYNRPECVVAVEPDGRGFKADSYDPKHDIKAILVDEVYQKVCEQFSSRSKRELS